MSTIHPIIFLSISDTGLDIVETIKKESKKLQSIHTENRYVRYIGMDKDGNINNSIDDTIINIPLVGDVDKTDSYKGFNQKRLEIKTVIEKAINSIYNLNNTNYASENNLSLGRPQIVLLGSFDFAPLSSFIISLLQSFDSFTFIEDNKPQLHLILIYNSKLQSDNNIDTAILKNAFFKEIESSRISKPFVWLIDIINEKSINLNNNSAVYYSISQFADLLYTSAGLITAPTTTMVNYSEKEKPCMYSTFGYSLMHFPTDKIKEYLSIHAKTQEFDYLVKDFDTKFEIIAIKDETTKFFRKNDFENIPQKISKKENADDIYIPLAYSKIAKHYDIEYEEVLSKKLSVVNNPTVISKTNTNDFFHQLVNINKQYEDEIYINYSSDIDAAKKRELAAINKVIQDTQIAFLDDKTKGINYAILFGAMLCNNQAAVQSMLEGRFVESIPSLNNLQDIYRGRFIGDQVQEIEKLLKVESDNSSNKKKLIEDYSAKLVTAEKTLGAIDVDPEVENPKLKELQIQIDDYKKQIDKLNFEIGEHNDQIEIFTKRIQEIKNEFDQLDPRKEIYRTKRNEPVLSEIVNIQNVKIPEQDKILSDNYTLKNDKLEERKKFIFWKLIVIPISFFAVLFSLELFIEAKWGLPEGWFIGILEILLSIEIVYYIFYLIKFYFLNKALSDFLDEVQSKLSEKKNLLSRFVELKNKFHFNNFSFENDLISFYMVDEIIKKAKLNQENIDNFKALISNKKQDFEQDKNKFLFNESPFEFCIITKEEIEKIYNLSTNSRIVNRIEGDVNFSKCYRDFIDTNALDSILKPIELQANDIYERKVETESLKTILFNESPNFSKNINTNAKFTQIMETSRPLLRTSQDITVSSPDIPYTQNITVGKLDRKFESYLSTIKFGDISIDENNKNTLGIISIKSNFPAFLIYDVIANEEVLRNNVTKDKQSKYFINESATGYSLVPTLNITSIEKGVLGNPIIAAISNKDIFYNTATEQFENETLGSLGFTFEELINIWQTNLCYDLVQNSKQLDDEIWDLEEPELSTYLNRFTDVWTNLALALPTIYEEELSAYYFSIKGTSEGWDSIIASIKSKRKTIFKK